MFSPRPLIRVLGALETQQRKDPHQNVATVEAAEW